MPTLIEKAAAKGWTVKAGTLQAKGLWHAFKEPIKSDDDVTVWCESANDAAREALKMQREYEHKQKKAKPKKKTRFGREVTQFTAKTIQDVMLWLETTPHHIASAEDPKVFVLKGHFNILRIPESLRKRCFVKPSENFDTRMYRWDFDAHKKHADKSREAREKKKKAKKNTKAK